MRMDNDLSGFTSISLKFIMNLTKEENDNYIYLNDDFKAYMIIPASYCFKHFSLNSSGERENTIELYFKDGENPINIP